MQYIAKLRTRFTIEFGARSLSSFASNADVIADARTTIFLNIVFRSTGLSAWPAAFHTLYDQTGISIHDRIKRPIMDQLHEQFTSGVPRGR